ncbi:hypothetical protein B0H10DRAFT_2034216 [Mycena sp. CBHHK59/15]|nr:hypothetical protein B0H10DRAFT_2034216 [Mycena sp. CBHHK59/15]
MHERWIPRRTLALCGRRPPPDFSRCYTTDTLPTPRHGGRPPAPVISTLDPRLLQPTDHIGPARKISLAVRFAARPDAPVTLPYYRAHQAHVRFPADARGFLYYHPEPHTLPPGGSVRLRVSADRAAFPEDGHDLALPSGAPWRVTLPQIAHVPTYATLRAQLLHERLASSDALAMQPDPARHRVATLDPARISRGDFLDPAQQSAVLIAFADAPDAPSARLTFQARALFPAHARGFLYWRPDAHPLAGSVRLRVTPDDAPSSFAHGTDLRLPSGAPWQIALAQIAIQQPRLAGLRAHLLAAHTVTPAQLAQCAALFGHRARMFPALTLFRLGQPFPVAFTQQVQLIVVAPTRVHCVRVPSVFTAQVRGRQTFPFSGTALASFERSSLPAHVGRRVLLLRILELTAQPAPAVRGYAGRVVPPAAGELFAVSIRGRPAAPWAFDVDGRSAAARVLRLLWDEDFNADGDS